jgi:hypothetical protein
VVYTWDYMHDQAREQAAALPIEGVMALLEFMAAAVLNPWGINLRPGEVRTSMPTVAFGDGGMVSFVILDEQRELVITKITWP